MHVERYEVDVTTGASDGAGTGYTAVPVTGRIVSIQYVKDATVPFADGSTMTVTGEKTGIAIWSEAAVNASAIRCPRQATHSTAGAASLYAVGGAAVNDCVFVAAERVKIAVSSAGNSKTGKYYVTVA